MLRLHLQLDSDLTRFQPPQVSVVNTEDGTVRCLLLTTAELFYRHQEILASGCFGSGGIGSTSSSSLPSNILRGSNFRISERYRCVADHRGQVQGGVGFIFEGVDMLNNTKVQVYSSCVFSRYACISRVSLRGRERAQSTHNSQILCLNKRDIYLGLHFGAVPVGRCIFATNRTVCLPPPALLSLRVRTTFDATFRASLSPSHFRVSYVVSFPRL